MATGPSALGERGGCGGRKGRRTERADPANRCSGGAGRGRSQSALAQVSEPGRGERSGCQAPAPAAAAANHPPQSLSPPRRRRPAAMAGLNFGVTVAVLGVLLLSASRLSSGVGECGAGGGAPKGDRGREDGAVGVTGCPGPRGCWARRVGRGGRALLDCARPRTGRRPWHVLVYQTGSPAVVDVRSGRRPRRGKEGRAEAEPRRPS